ncbi:MAG TPA: thioredoxin [Gammaproteobacteria bacterium]|nr:thioredoxin [Gammaproteobacteria bacterium]
MLLKSEISITRRFRSIKFLPIQRHITRHPLVLPLLACILFSVSSAAATRDPGEHFFQQSFGDLTEELAIASEEGKQGVFIMFEEKDCPWCAKMKARVLNHVEVQDYYRKHFRILSLDISGDELITDFKGNEVSQKAFADQIRVRATPVLLFFDLQGKKTVRYTGAVRNVQEFMWLGEFVVDGHYKTGKFSVYKREKKKTEPSPQPSPEGRGG